jgi:hypothetical protein
MNERKFTTVGVTKLEGLSWDRAGAHCSMASAVESLANALPGLGQKFSIGDVYLLVSDQSEA